MSITIEKVQQGKVVFGANEYEVDSLPWNNHPTFTGVALKHLITGKDTADKFSCHLVRIDTGCEIGSHIHVGKWELHEVVKGKGYCLIENSKIAYGEGIVTVIPADLPHSVFADEQLYLLAKFVPALL